jgi:non-ribosomal peptide synthetase component F
MSDLSTPVTNLPPEQEAIRAKCFHPTGIYAEFKREEVEQSIPQRFEEMVRLHPQRLALKSRNYALTYEALNQAANRIAHAILSKEGKQDEPVALLLGNGVSVNGGYLRCLKDRQNLYPFKFLLSSSKSQLHTEKFTGRRARNR